MKTLPILIALVCSVSARGDDEASTLAAIRQRVVEAATARHEAVTVENSPGTLIIRRNTMVYRIHAIDKTGEISPTSHEETGPKADGFLITITRQEGEYRGAAELPQTMSGPYWKTHVTSVPVDGNRNHLHVRLSYGSRVPETVIAELVAAITRGGA